MTLNLTGVFHFITTLFHLAHSCEKLRNGETEAT